MSRYEYVKLPINLFPPDIISQYKLLPLVHDDDHVYMEIQKGMYRLPQAGRLANDQLKKHLQKYGYIHSKKTNGLWTHQTLDTVFTLVVNNFRIKYISKENENHLINALKDLYKVTIDWTGRHFIGINLQWNYTLRNCNLSMPGYVKKALERFKHKLCSPTESPSKHIVRYSCSKLLLLVNNIY